MWITDRQHCRSLSCRGDWGEMKQGQVETVPITFMVDNA